MYLDAHVHSAASPDSEQDPVDVINTLQKMSLGVVFTEHADFVTPTLGKDETATDSPDIPTDFICDFDIYPAQYRRYRSDSVFLGIELALNAAFLPLNSQTADNDYDFVIGSVHYVDGYDIYSGAAEMDAESFCRRYLTYSKEMVELCGFFDALGHIDYVARYSPAIDKLFYYKNFPAEFDALFSSLAERGLALEINTARFGNNNVIKQLLPMYKRFRALGGRYVTIGSDAHFEWALGQYHAQAVELAAMAGLTLVYYKERKLHVCTAN